MLGENLKNIRIAVGITQVELAKKLGYDAVLLSPGGLRDLSEDELIERTEAVAKVLPVIGFYLQPAVGGRVFTYNYWERMCAIDNVVAIKAARSAKSGCITLHSKH